MQAYEFVTTNIECVLILLPQQLNKQKGNGYIFADASRFRNSNSILKLSESNLPTTWILPTPFMQFCTVTKCQMHASEKKKLHDVHICCNKLKQIGTNWIQMNSECNWYQMRYGKIRSDY